jgi:hypothetical protein
MGPEGSLSCSQNPTTELYPEPAGPVRPIDPYRSKVHLNVIFPPTPRSSQLVPETLLGGEQCVIK